MREIKFRAWNGERMKEVLTWGFSEGFISTPKESSPEEDFKIMQYTGLKDKNGVEIYEGDIVKFHYRTGIYKLGPVVWNDLFGTWDIDCADFVAYKSLGQFKSVSEVIGNIHENPELLES